MSCSTQSAYGSSSSSSSFSTSSSSHSNLHIAEFKALSEKTDAETKKLFEKCISKDDYNNCIINLSGVPELGLMRSQKVVSKALSELIKNKKHDHLVACISQKQHNLYSCLVEKDFQVYSSGNKDILLKRCLGHKDNECLYPPYKTMTIGVTVVVFDKDLTNFLAVQEKKGSYLGWKAPTGTVDYEKKEDEITAAVREVYEETHLKINTDQLSLVGMAPTDSLHGRSPDRNFVFACKTDSLGALKPQEKEIRNVAWLPVEEFLKSELPVLHKSRPLVLQEVVRVAKDSLQANRGWKPGLAYWSSGREAVLYQELKSKL